MDYQIIDRDPTTGVISLKMPRKPRILRGVDKLVQEVILSILKNRGQDVFDPKDGSGLRSLIGQFNVSGTNEIKTEVVTRIKDVERQTISNQAGTDTPSTEKLKKLDVLEVVSDNLTFETMVRLRITPEIGASTDVLV